MVEVLSVPWNHLAVDIRLLNQTLAFFSFLSAPTSPPSPEVIGRQVERAIRNGDYRAARQRLDPKERVVFTPNNIARVKQLHPSPLLTDTAPPYVPMPPIVGQFHFELLGDTLHHAPKGKAPGVFADSPDVLRDFASRYYPLTKFTDSMLLDSLYSRMTAGYYPKEVQTIGWYSTDWHGHLASP